MTCSLLALVYKNWFSYVSLIIIFQNNKRLWKQTILLSFQIVGVVYGQLSTAPLYVFSTMRVKDLESEEVVYELFSFIFWTLTTISLIKYALIVLKADDKGEGTYVIILLFVHV
jgi:KUP system potassium uptake protein/transcriptional repressor NF-X1